MSNLDALPDKRLTGSEQFTFDSKPIGVGLLSFWQWSESNLVGNALRGVVAEYIVATAVDVNGGVRTEWDAYDILTTDGLKIEVKSAAYLQSWSQTDFSPIIFSIGEKRGWDAATNIMSAESKRQADVYVFCVLKHKDKATVNPLNLDQWSFYCLSTADLNQMVGGQKTIALSSLLKLNPIEATYSNLAEAIQTAL